ncbi:hypothetical protein TIFTF001_030039 [Ficus carica]|uniref:Methyltransferase n=1 Tax=Ficus carica TaxID=3494 RepID=A0AA88DSF9_FICCA|nr:hypothetical protein TIFTF001_030039 [Ficus carica]
MADLFIKQANQYAENRPDYPKELFEFIASKTPLHDLVWDVGTGSGQAAQSIAPDWRQALSLKKTVEDRIAKDGVIGIGITATAVGLIAGGIAAALARKK